MFLFLLSFYDFVTVLSISPCCMSLLLVFASELNPRRARLMSNRLSAAGVTNCDVIVKSFFTLDPQDPKFAKVKYILLDPSCSGRYDQYFPGI